MLERRIVGLNHVITEMIPRGGGDSPGLNHVIPGEGASLESELACCYCSFFDDWLQRLSFYPLKI